VLTSNRTRELSDALKRRCLYHWVDYPDLEKEMTIVKKRLPDIENELLQQVVHAVQHFRKRKLVKIPGISETIDWAQALMTLGFRSLDSEAMELTLGSILKSVEDIRQVKEDGVEAFV
jgi:MoxR-like ATPase